MEMWRNLSLLFVCRVLRGDAECPVLVEQLVRLYIPYVPRITLIPRERPLLAVQCAGTAELAASVGGGGAAGVNFL